LAFVYLHYNVHRETNRIKKKKKKERGIRIRRRVLPLVQNNACHTLQQYFIPKHKYSDDL